MQIHVVDHPLIKEKMTRLRDKNTQPKDFRQLLDQIAQLLLFEVTRDLPVRHKKVTTPLAETTGYELDVSGITVVPILRAGLGFLDAVMDLVPEAKVGHIGLTRDEETLQPIKYYCKMPKDKDAEIILIDPMLATGGSAEAAISRMATNIFALCALWPRRKGLPLSTAAIRKCPFIRQPLMTI